jgi:hypothetical protein
MMTTTRMSCRPSAPGPCGCPGVGGSRNLARVRVGTAKTLREATPPKSSQPRPRARGDGGRGRPVGGTWGTVTRWQFPRQFNESPVSGVYLVAG